MRVYKCFPGGKAKALTMSYDDGKLQDEKLVDIFNKHGIKGTFNLNYGLMNQPERLPMERIKELYKGHEIATHTMTHPTIARCPLSSIASEILEDRAGLEKLSQSLVRGHAYPNGSYSEDIKLLFSKLGIAYARVVESIDNYELPGDYLEWHPTCHHNDDKLLERAKWFVEFQKKQYLKLMYVWGHSYEFDNDHNWDKIEAFCKVIGGKNDIWYATNIEIMDYMEVLKRLQLTAKGDGIKNPSSKSAWLQVNDEKIYEVKAGEFLMLS